MAQRFEMEDGPPEGDERLAARLIAVVVAGVLSAIAGAAVPYFLASGAVTGEAGAPERPPLAAAGAPRTDSPEAPAAASSGSSIGAPREPEPTPAARTTCAVSGSTWVTRANGDVVRPSGMDIAVLRARLDAAATARAHRRLTAILDRQKRELTEDFSIQREAREDALRRIAIAKQLLRVQGSSVDAVFTVINTSRKLADERLESIRARSKSVVRKHDAQRVHTDTFDRLLEVQSTAFGSAQVAVGTTDANGQYAIPEIPPGDYLLFARHSNDAWLIEWLGAFPAPGPGDYTFDLSTENARYLENHR